MPYDKLVEGIVTGVSRKPGESYAEYCAAMSKMYRRSDEAVYRRPSGICRISGRGNNLNKPEERAIGFAYTFLGIRIQCAQCHKHPFDQWSKDDFDDFTELLRAFGRLNTARPATARSGGLQKNREGPGLGELD